jgi:hypothetical protein
MATSLVGIETGSAVQHAIVVKHLQLAGLQSKTPLVLWITEQFTKAFSGAVKHN